MCQERNKASAMVYEKEPTTVDVKRVKERAVDLRWNRVMYRLNADEKKEKTILNGVSGVLEGASLLAIMGPSGSGKTSLLNVLAGRVPHSKKASLSGTITVGGRPQGAVRSAYVMQDEALFELSTVRETLMFTAKLRLPHGTPLSAMVQRVQEVLAELNLGKLRAAPEPRRRPGRPARLRT